MSARILVVDDMAANAGLLAAKLSAEYYQLAIAGSGHEALELASDWQPDMVMLDVMMPGMDGYEVCRRLKSDPRTMPVPVVLVTGLEAQSERLRGLAAGADDFLCKPIDYELLLARTRALVRLKRQLDGWRTRWGTARELGLGEGPRSMELVEGSQVLMIGDHDGHLGQVRAALALDQIDVAAVSGLEAAFERISPLLPDLMLVDLAMTGADPLSVVAGLCSDPRTRSVPLVLIAPTGGRARCLRGFDIGANDWVMAPIDPSELRARVRNQIRRKNYHAWLRYDLDQALDLAVTDELTGLHNQRYLRRRMHRPPAVMGSDKVALLMIDIDHFKSVNDLFGHAKGDEVLRGFANELRRQARATDVVTRYGGEEFVMLMYGAGLEEAVAAAERLRSAVAATPFQPFPGVMHRVTVSIGVATADLREADAEDLLRRADKAMYIAKHAGRDRVQVALRETVA